MTRTLCTVLLTAALGLGAATGCEDDPQPPAPDTAVVADQGGGKDVAPPPDGPTVDSSVCGPGATLCGGVCVNLKSDNQNCGACNTACKAGLVCAAGACALTCPLGQKKCAGGDGGASYCAKTSTDTQNCGACGTACAAGQVCAAGVCAFACPPGQKKCGGGDAGASFCATLASDTNNCGACGKACGAGQVCALGICTLSCPGGQQKCSGGDAGASFCAKLQSDPQNCGACGNSCAPGTVCAAGACVLSCPPGQKKCAAGDAGAPVCADVKVDAKNCGSCGKACAPGQVCAGGTCLLSCPAGQQKCGGGDAGAPQCVNPKTDNNNCGSCGKVCAAGQICAAGACVLSCPIGLQKCGGKDAGAPVCTSTQTDPSHCGACGKACATGQVCSSGACAVTCASGKANCSGACVDLLSDTKNCGKCGGACKQGQLCCGGSCTDVLSNNKHCGACNNACGSFFPCYKGTCSKVVSCAHILAGNPSAKSGVYTIVPGAAVGPVDVYCDMTTDGGGWTLALNLDTSDGHVMWWGNALWTNKLTRGTAATALTADHKSKTWWGLPATQLMLVVHEEGTYKGWKVFRKTATKPLDQYQKGGDNTLIAGHVMRSSTANVWSKERLVRLSTKLYANRCIQYGGKCTTGSAGSPDGDRIGSVESNPKNNYGGGLGNWHDMNYCCKGKSYGSGKVCNGSAFRTVSEAQAGWGSTFGTFGSDSLAPMTGKATDSPCTNAAWAKQSGVAYDYAVFLRTAQIPASCAELKMTGTTKSGVYTIDPTGGSSNDAFKVHCDMTTDGGGWTIVYSATGADGEQPMVSDKAVTGDPLTFKHHNLDRAKKMALSAVSSESLFRRKDGVWLKADRALFDSKLGTKNSHAHYSVTLTASNKATAKGWIGYSNYGITHGGDFNLSSTAVSNGVDHHNSSYYHLNSGCKAHYLYSYSLTAGDGDAGYDVSTALGSWTATQSCDAAEGGTLVFYAAVR